MDILDDPSADEMLDVPVKPGTIRIILADSQAIYRVGIRKVFALEDDLRAVAQADSIENLRAAIQRYPTDIVLMEGSLLAGTANVIPDLLRIAPELKLICGALMLPPRTDSTVCAPKPEPPKPAAATTFCWAKTTWAC